MKIAIAVLVIASACGAIAYRHHQKKPTRREFLISSICENFGEGVPVSVSEKDGIALYMYRCPSGLIYVEEFFGLSGCPAPDPNSEYIWVCD